jgi:hypothetical protein
MAWTNECEAAPAIILRTDHIDDHNVVTYMCTACGEVYEQYEQKG